MSSLIPSVVVHGPSPLAPEWRVGWPDLLSAELTRIGSTHGPVINAAGGSVHGFAEVVRSVRPGAWGGGAVHVLSLSYLDGRSGRLSPPDALVLALGCVRLLRSHGAERVIVVGPTPDQPTEGKKVPKGYSTYARWRRRIDAALSSGLDGEAEYVPLAALPDGSTIDGIRPNARGWKWVASRVAGALAGAP